MYVYIYMCMYINIYIYIFDIYSFMWGTTINHGRFASTAGARSPSPSLAGSRGSIQNFAAHVRTCGMTGFCLLPCHPQQ